MPVLSLCVEGCRMPVLSLCVEGCKMPGLVSPEDNASDGEGDPASDPPHEEDNIGDDI